MIQKLASTTTARRYYDSNAGRFLNQDPIGFTGGNNFYAYAQNSVIDMRDPSGLAPDWWKTLQRQMFGAQVSDCVRDLLKQYFPQLNFDKVRLRMDITLGWVGISGITNGYDIAYDPDAINGSVNGIQNLAHELVHVGQFAKKGKIGFYYGYARDYIRNRMSMNDNDAYRNIPDEAQAFALENKIESDLIKKFGLFGQPCKDVCK